MKPAAHLTGSCAGKLQVKKCYAREVALTMTRRPRLCKDGSTATSITLQTTCYAIDVSRLLSTRGFCLVVLLIFIASWRAGESLEFSKDGKSGTASKTMKKQNFKATRACCGYGESLPQGCLFGQITTRGGKGVVFSAFLPTQFIKISVKIES